MIQENGLETWLTDAQVMAFLNRIKVKDREPNLATLRCIIKQIYTCIPFQNFTMLCRPRKPPSQAQIIADMLLGIGGLCTTTNPFLCALLQHLDFKAGLLSVSMNRPNCHIGVIVFLADSPYWVDVGNGFPYLEPLPLHNGAKHRVLDFEYELIQHKNTWAVKQSILGTRQQKINQRFYAIPCHYSTFELMRQQHYTKPDYGPFLVGLRLNRWTNTAGFILRDQLVWNLPYEKYRVNKNQAQTWLEQYFPASALQTLFSQSWEKIFEHTD